MIVVSAGVDDEPCTGPPTWFAHALVAELPALRRTAAWVVGAPSRRDDVVQETLLRACRSWRSFDPSRPMAPWLRRLAVVSAAELDRADRRAAGAVVGWWADGSVPGSEEHLASLDRRRDVHAALGALSPRDRALLWCRDVDGTSFGLLASVAGGSEVALRQALSRARRRFRVAYLAVVEAGRGCAVGLAAALERWRRRATSRLGAERLLPLAGVSAAAAAVLVVVAVPVAVVLDAASATADDAEVAGVAPPPVAVAEPPSVAATGPVATAPPEPPAPRPAGPTPGPVPSSWSPVMAVLGADSSGARGAVGLEHTTPTGDVAVLYQGVEIRCDRSAVAASTCAVLRVVAQETAVVAPGGGRGDVNRETAAGTNTA